MSKIKFVDAHATPTPSRGSTGFRKASAGEKIIAAAEEAVIIAPWVAKLDAADRSIAEMHHQTEHHLKMIAERDAEITALKAHINELRIELAERHKEMVRLGEEIVALKADLAQQDVLLDKQFRSIPDVTDVTSAAGDVTSSTPYVTSAVTSDVTYRTVTDPKQPWHDWNVSRMTWYRWKKANKLPADYKPD